MAAAGIENQEIARACAFRDRPYNCGGSDPGIARRRAGKGRTSCRPDPRITSSQVAAIVEATLHRKPPNATHWSTRTMAKAQGVSEASVRRIWQRHNLNRIAWTPSS